MRKTKNIVIPIILVIFSYINIFLFYIRFSIADDYLINNIISGTFGNAYDYQILYINNVLGIVLKLFYYIIPKINIYTLYLVIVLCICFSKIVECLLKRKNYYLLPIIFVLYLLTLYNITYTIIAYLSVIIGILEILFNKEKKNYLDYYLIINGALLRDKVIFPVCIVLGTILVVSLIKNKEINKIKSFFWVILVIIVLNLCGKLIYSSNSDLKEFSEWQNACIKIRDYKSIKFDNYNNVFQEVNWNENDLKMFYSWNFADKEKFSKESMEKIVKTINLQDRYNFNIKDIILKYFKQFITADFNINNMYIIIFIAMFILAFVKTKSRKECVFVFFSTIFLNILLIVRDRYPYRVVYPQYLLAISYYIYNCADIKIEKKNVVLWCNFVICSIFSIIFIFNYNMMKDYYIQKNQKSSSIIEEINNSGNLYISDSNTYNYLTMDYKISERKKIGEYRFIIKTGGGDCFSKRYNNYIDRFKLKYKFNLFKNLPQENVYYIGKTNEILIRYLIENVDINGAFTEIKNYDDITIYKYHNN